MSDFSKGGGNPESGQPIKTTLAGAAEAQLLPSASSSRRGQIMPLDVQHQEFGSGWRGYRKADVQAYLSEVAQSLEADLRERAAIEQRLSEMQRQIQDYKAAEDELRRTVVAAERIGHELKEQSRQEAMLTVQKAEHRSALLLEVAKNREQEALERHESRLRELESTFSVRRAQLESLYQAQEHELENRARERSAALEREFSARHADLSGRLSSAHTEYAQFMSQYRAVSQAFAQAANAHLLPDTAGLASYQIGEGTVSKSQRPSAVELSKAGQSGAPPSGAQQSGAQQPNTKQLSPEVAAVQIEEQRF
ncbi:DivIVA domain-containing protein [Deinococcus detaillensis]|uniref:DivIVA domain-containing protein n=1 Tax=Deinococcus detaillensis TaxID=2592048 RepID=A0A553UWW2_9DEIO|nr:DivIVA domain-containing protein [Deinococcus detaillensis]TSA84687.1 DivIVA domain-containing protein [Deinococcus detaillensis]